MVPIDFYPALYIPYLLYVGSMYTRADTGSGPVYNELPVEGLKYANNGCDGSYICVFVQSAYKVKDDLYINMASGKLFTLYGDTV